MNVFNRVVVVVLLLALMAAVALVMVWPAPTTSLVVQGVAIAGDFLTRLVPWVVLVAGILALIVLLIILVLELRRPRARAVKIDRVTDGEAYLKLDSIARRLAYHVDRLVDVVGVTPRVRARGGSVDVWLEVETVPDIEVPMKTSEILAVVKDQIEDKMGLKLHRAKVQLKSSSYPRQAPLVREAAQSWQPAPEAPAPAPELPAPIISASDTPAAEQQ
jgi:hypothetical protein